MSQATSGALSGAASGAAAGSVVPGWGTAIGAVVGGVSGYLGGMAGDKKAAAKAAAAKRLRKANSRYSAQTQSLNTAGSVEAGALGDDYRAALQQYAGQHPAALPRFQDAQAQTMQAGQTAAAPAWQPMQTPANTGAEQRYVQALQADRMGRANAAAAPGANGLAQQQVALQDRAGQQQQAYSQAELAQAMDRIRSMNGLQQQLAYEPLAAAKGKYAVDRQKAEQAGSSLALASGLIGAGGNLAASYGIARNTPPPPTYRTI